MGFSIGQGFQSALGAGNASAKANNRLSQVNADAGNKVRAASNAAEAAEGNLQRFVQSVNNQREMNAAGRALEANTVNSARMSDAATRGGFSDDIRAAEQAGHMAASAAVAGVSGNAVDTVNQATDLRNAIVHQSIEDNADSATYDVSRRAGNIMSQLVGGIDSSVISDHLDYNVNYAQQSPILPWFARTLQGFFPAGTDALGGFRDAAGSASQSLQTSYNSYQDRKSGNATYNQNASPSSNYSFDYGQYDPNSSAMLDPNFDYGSSDGYGGDSYDFGSF